MPSQIEPCRKIFLQWLLSERVVEEGQAKQFFSRAVEQLEDTSGYGIVNQSGLNCRQAVSLFSLDIKKLKFLEDQTELIGLVNTNGDSIAQLATDYSAEEVKVFKILIKLIAEAPDFEVATNSVIAALDNHVVISRAECIRFLDSLTRSLWIHKKKSNGKLSLGPRTILELADFLRGNMTESSDQAGAARNPVFKDCDLCSSLICSGKVYECGTEECEGIYHKACHEIYSRATRNACSKCKRPNE